MGASPVPIAGRSDLAGKIAIALGWMRRVMRIGDLRPPALPRAGEAGDGTSTPARYTGTQVIAPLEWPLNHRKNKSIATHPGRLGPRQQESIQEKTVLRGLDSHITQRIRQATNGLRDLRVGFFESFEGVRQAIAKRARQLSLVIEGLEDLFSRTAQLSAKLLIEIVGVFEHLA